MNWYSGKVLGGFKERTSDSIPTVQGTEGMPCSKDQDRMFKAERLLPGRHMLTKLYSGTMGRTFLKFIKQMTEMRMKSPAFST